MRKNGYTMIEVVVAGGIISVMVLVLMELYIRGFEVQRSVMQRQGATMVQLRVASLLSDRKICELNFRDQRTDAMATDTVTRIVTSTSPDVVVFQEGGLYEDESVRLTGLRLHDFRPYGTSGDNMYRGTMELTMTLEPVNTAIGGTPGSRGNSLGAVSMVRTTILLVELNGFPPAGGANLTWIRTCVSAGSNLDNIWTRKTNGDIYYTGFNVGIGTNMPNQMLDVNGNVLALAYLHSSDERLKKNIAPAPGLAAVKQLNGVHFVWKKTGQPSLGLLAQNVERVFPDAVATDPRTGLKSVAYSQLIGPLIESVKDLARENETMERQIQALERQSAAAAQ